MADFVRGLRASIGCRATATSTCISCSWSARSRLLRANGRLGLVLPSGFAVDHGCASLRRALFERTRVDTLHGFENREGLFPIHRGLKFLLATATVGPQTTNVPARFGLRRAETLDALADSGVDAQSVPLPRSLLEKLSGDAAGRARDSLDGSTWRSCRAIAFSAPPLGDPDGWHVTFGRELNATDDKRHFVSGGTGLPVIDGKHIQPVRDRLVAEPDQASGTRRRAARPARGRRAIGRGSPTATSHPPPTGSR